MNVQSQGVGKSDEAPFWFNPYSELYELLFEEKDGQEEGGEANGSGDPGEVRAALVGAFGKGVPGEEIAFEMDELGDLVGVLGHRAGPRFVQRTEKRSRTQYVGRGKLMEIRDAVEREGIAYVACNHELSTLQYKTMSDMLKVPVIDRTMIVLEIFSRNACSKESKLQVQIALLRYLSSRINRMNVSERSASDRSNAAFNSRGKGESPYELGQRKLKGRIAHIEKEMAKMESAKEVQKKRRRDAIKLILVGYTNAGKTSVMNGLAGERLVAGDQIFLTTGSTYRKIGACAGKDVLICDTVGFVSNLPTTWIEGFRTTVEEIGEADYILHVVDASDAHREQKKKVTEDLLDKIHADRDKVILIGNKIDQVAGDDGEIGALRADICVSARDKGAIRRLRAYLFDRIEEDRGKVAQ